MRTIQDIMIQLKIGRKSGLIEPFFCRPDAEFPHKRDGQVLVASRPIKAKEPGWSIVYYLREDLAAQLT